MHEVAGSLDAFSVVSGVRRFADLGDLSVGADISEGRTETVLGTSIENDGSS